MDEFVEKWGSPAREAEMRRDLEAVLIGQAGTSLEDTRTLLRHRQADWSQDHFCAGWDRYAEQQAWQWGLTHPEDEEAQELRALALRAGGWWVWDDEASGLRFLPLAEWEKRYAELTR